MAFLIGLPSAVATPRLPTPTGRYAHTNPLRREWGLRLLTESLPEPLRWSIIRAWHRPSAARGDVLDLPSLPRQYPDDDVLLRRTPYLLSCSVLVELELAWRMIETPKERTLPAMRNNMLSEQSVYLRRLYNALALKIGAAAALATFQNVLAG